MRKGRVLTLEPSVRVVVMESGQTGVRVICPVCRASRTFSQGVVIVPAEVKETTSPG
jgi:hypothetical protein